MTVTGDLISEATAELRRVLAGTLDADWSVPAGDLEWTCRETGEHIADDLFSYASQVLARPTRGYLPVEARLESRATPETLIRVVAMCGDLLRLAVAATPRDARAWHPNGVSDPEGFAAMGIVEVLVHTHDIAIGLGVEWRPPGGLSAPVLLRLFPDAPSGDPSDVLLWCTGRAALGELPRQTQWRWDSSVRRQPSRKSSR
jgi:hypothetical protein